MNIWELIWLNCLEIFCRLYEIHHENIQIHTEVRSVRKANISQLGHSFSLDVIITFINITVQYTMTVIITIDVDMSLNNWETPIFSSVIVTLFPQYFGWHPNIFDKSTSVIITITTIITNNILTTGVATTTLPLQSHSAFHNVLQFHSLEPVNM